MKSSLIFNSAITSELFNGRHSSNSTFNVYNAIYKRVLFYVSPKMATWEFQFWLPVKCENATLSTLYSFFFFNLTIGYRLFLLLSTFLPPRSHGSICLSSSLQYLCKHSFVDWVPIFFPDHGNWWIPNTCAHFNFIREIAKSFLTI